jgi:hypothetical protein
MAVLPALALVMGLASMEHAPVMAPTKPLTLPVAVFDYADVPSQWLSRAKEEMSRIYREIGVEITWHDLRSDNTLPQEVLIVLIRPGLRSVEESIPQGVIGFSGTADERRRVAYILDQFRPEQFPPIYRERLLGHFMAHEVGHLLLPARSHSPTGLMRAQWTRAELERAQQRRLRFTDEQAQLIRTKVSRLAVRRRD